MKHNLHAYCKICSVQVELREEGSFSKRRPADESIPPSDPVDIPWITEEYVLCSCPKCESPFLLKREWYEIPAEYETVTKEPELIFPSASRLPISSLPQVVSKSYQAAVRSLEVGLYEPCLIMCRKSLEGICHEQGISKGNLKEKLSQLKDKGIIDAKLHKWADGLRLVANDAAHDLDAEIYSQDANDSLQFIEALISYVFLLGKRFEEFELRRKK